MKHGIRPIIRRLLSVICFAALALIALMRAASLIPSEEPIAEISDGTKPESGTVYVDDSKSSSLDPNELASQMKQEPNGSVRLVTDTSLFADELATLPGAGRLSSEGYYTSDLPYVKDSFIIAKMTPEFDIPGTFSVRLRTVRNLRYVQLSDYSKFTPEYTDSEEDRPAIELYMGYLFIDNGERIDIFSSSGRYLTTFDDSDFIPAYTRDTDGAPLFYKTVTVNSGMYDGEDVVRDKETVRAREPHEKEENVQIIGKIENEGEGNPVTEETKVYYRLSSDGSYFIQSSYNDLTDGRGLYFDYPAYYGISDSGISLSAETYNKYLKDINGKITLEHRADWCYKLYDNVITDRKFDRAFAFSDGLGCVLTEDYYQDGGMYFVNSSGRRAFETVRKYNNSMDRYVIENIVSPITTGPESIGYFYYDHGLVRARLETIDYWSYVTNNIIRVNSSREILLDKSGNHFPLPVGYDLESYSDGMILLSRNGMYGFMDYTGEWIAQPVYTDAEPFSEGLAVLTLSDGRCGMIDTDGNIVLPFGYSYISSCSDGIIVAYSESKGWEIFRKMTA